VSNHGPYSDRQSHFTISDYIGLFGSTSNLAFSATMVATPEVEAHTAKLRKGSWVTFDTENRGCLLREGARGSLESGQLEAIIASRWGTALRMVAKEHEGLNTI